jgi:hypothetical protein
LRHAVQARPREYGIAEIWRVQGAEHLMALATEPDGYRDRLEGFLDSAAPVRMGEVRNANDE